MHLNKGRLYGVFETLPQEIKPRVCIHRGMGGENTAGAIDEAISFGPPYVEFDINYVEGSFQS